MKLQLLYGGDPKLAIPSKPITTINKSILKLAFYMHEHMKTWQGVGLSAPQVGKNINLLVVGTKEYPRLTIINPKLVSIGEEKFSRIEGCLSFPGVFKYRNRPQVITLEFQTEKNEAVVMNFSGITAQVIIHEMMHLKGVTLLHKDIDNTEILLYTDNNSD